MKKEERKFRFKYFKGVSVFLVLFIGKIYVEVLKTFQEKFYQM